MPLTSGFSVMARRSTSTPSPSVVMANARMVPVRLPAAATMSKFDSLVTPSTSTLNTRWPACDVPSYWLAK